MNDFINVMKALSDHNRVRIVKVLQSKPLCVCELQELLSIPQPAVSKHMKVLEKAGLVEGKKEGLWVYYSLKHKSNNPYALVLLGNLRQWFQNDTSLEKMYKKLPALKRKPKCIR
ncbi:MAG TPA: metalloregulator ArsR/SmtB family transcription factor [Smithellaceae bacterium]|nr:metalloregulator ArsR/SmtB family transcription factor [Smithellaceae bacterium]